MRNTLSDIIERYKGNYIKKIREKVGHDPVMTTACGVIIENENGEILLQQRKDNGKWGILGGAMELGEKFIDTAKREVLEEAGIEVENLRLFGIYSGEGRIVEYPNGDICCVTSIVFRTRDYKGQIRQKTDEALQHRFFRKDALPGDVNRFDRQYLDDWSREPEGVVVE